MSHKCIIILALFFTVGCSTTEPGEPDTDVMVTGDLPSIPTPMLTLEEANRLAVLPLKCMQTEYPNKLNQTLGTKTDLQAPKVLHPAFYGCFDWHSAVHGHWMLVSLLKQFPDLDSADVIRQRLAENIATENIAGEVEYFSGTYNTGYERTYGWAWLLKLAEELHTWEDTLGQQLSTNLQPLTDLIVQRYLHFLPKLVYPIRVGEHTNTAFGLTFAWDYASATNQGELKALIEERAKEWFLTDSGCPLSWEPSGYDFLSPCLEEADLMRRVLPANEFKDWLAAFLPQLSDLTFTLAPGQVSDRSDGKLVHLDGLNFSRAWCLYGIANQFPEYAHLAGIANAHINHSLPGMTDGAYEGEHWLASFAVWALNISNSRP